MTEAALALNARRRFLAVRTRTVSNMAAHTTMSAPTIPTVGGVHCLTGANRIQAWHARTRVRHERPFRTHGRQRGFAH